MRRDLKMPVHMGVSSGEGLPVDIFLKKGPVEGGDRLAVNVHIPLSMIAALELPPPEQEYVVKTGAPAGQPGTDPPATRPPAAPEAVSGTN